MLDHVQIEEVCSPGKAFIANGYMHFSVKYAEFFEKDGNSPSETRRVGITLDGKDAIFRVTRHFDLDTYTACISTDGRLVNVTGLEKSA